MPNAPNPVSVSDGRTRGRTIWWIAGSIVALVAVWLTCWVDYDATTVRQRDFVIDVPFERFRKIMVRTNATQAIIERSGMELIDQKTENIDLQLDPTSTGRPLQDLIAAAKDYDIRSEGTIEVRPNDPYLEGETLKLKQEANVTPTSLDATTRSVKPGGKLLDYQTTLSAGGDAMRTNVSMSINMTILASVPWMLGSIADNRVREAADKSLQQQELVLREVIEEHRDDTFILPDGIKEKLQSFRNKLGN